MNRTWKCRISKLLVTVMLWGLFASFISSGAVAGAANGSETMQSSSVSWDAVGSLGQSVQAGWNGFQLGQLQLTNDQDNLYYRVTAVNVQDWQNVNIALNVNGIDSGQSDNPLHQKYRFTGNSKPQYQIVLDAGSKLPQQQVGLYSSNQLGAPLLSAASPQGAVFNGNAQTGFEGSIPLAALNLKNGDQIQGMVILSGDNANEHGAFDVIPESPENTVATSWNMKDAPNTVSAYSEGYTIALNYSPIVDGERDAVWEAVYTLGDSNAHNAIGGGAEIHQYKVTNDNRNIYFWMDVKIPNWAEKGQLVDIALQINNEDSTVSGNPIGAAYNFSGTPAKPKYHLTMRVKNDREIYEAALYHSGDWSHPLASYPTDSQGAEFAVNREAGFEASIPLKLLGLKNGDQVRSIVVLTGNNDIEHGAFQVIPQDTSNQVASSWQEQNHPNVQSTYTSPYTITGYSSKLDLINTSPANHEMKAPIDRDIKAVFTENIEVANEAGILLWDDKHQSVPITVSHRDNQLLINPKNKLAYNQTYEVQIAEGTIRGTETNTSNMAYSFSFTTKEIPRIATAFADQRNEVTVILGEVIPNLDYSQFSIYDGDTELRGEAVQGDVPKKVVIRLQDPITDVAHPYVIRYQDREQADVYPDQSLTMRSILDDYVYNENDLGVTYQSAQSTFKVWAPTAQEVSVLVYNDPKLAKEAPSSTYPMTKDMQSGVWSHTVQGDLEGEFYMYLVKFANGVTTYALDPYARASSVNSTKSAIVDLTKTDPVGWKPDEKPPMVGDTDAILYELHARDFSMDEHSGISAVNRGKFMAFTEKGTTLPGHPDVKTGIDHLKELGITHVHLLPFYDFGSIDETKVDDPSLTERKFNWGYDPVNYNVPEGSYATNSSVEDPAKRIKEMKSMIQSLHDNGIRIVLDVVYNHTYTTGLESEFSVFDKIVPGYFYRSNDYGEFTNGSGVGNEVASERPMVSKYVKDSVAYLAKEYNVDGFRFDLMALIDVNTMKSLTKELKQEDPSILIYGEPWKGGDSALPSELRTDKGKQRGAGFAVFNDNIRGAIKGGSDDDSRGFATGASGQEDAIIRGVEGSINDITDSPTETINYVTAHDNLNLWDKVLKTQHKDGNIANNPFETLTESNVLDNETVKRSLLANGIIFTSQGIPFMHAGDELLRSKFGDHNSYQSSDEINKVRWEQKEKYKPVFDYIQGLIELRRSHPAFRMTTKEEVASHMSVLQKSDDVVAFQLKNYAHEDSWKNIVVIYNANTEARDVTLPSAARWNIVVDQTAAGVKTLRTITNNKVQVAGLSMMVLYDQTLDYTPKASTVEITPNQFGLEQGMSKVVTAIVKDQQGRPMQGQAIQWHSSDSSVATVNTSGKVVAKATGTAMITASVGDVEGKAKVEVTRLIPTTIKLMGADYVYTTRTIALTAEVKDQFGQPILNPSMQWISSNEAIAKVDRLGKVTGVSEGTATITAKSGTAQATQKMIVKPLVKRYIQLNYVRPDKNFDNWAVWVWQTGAVEGKIEFSKINGNTATANIEIGPDTESIGYLIFRGEWEEKDPPTDRIIKTNLNDTVTKVFSYSGQVPIKTVPSVNGPELENGNITFVYRDEDVFLNGGVDRITEMNVIVNGKAYAMTYDAENERFVYTLKNVESGNYVYSFEMTKYGKTTTFLDPKNNEDGKSVITYAKTKVDVLGSIAPSTIYVGQNRVLKVRVQADQGVSIREIYADLSPLGGSSHLGIDPELMEQTIAVQDHIAPGRKQIDIVAVDEYGNQHRGVANVQVVAKPDSNGKLDFDWDEARIYFVLTDRFNDGNPSNNGTEAEGYDKGHPEAYHGGDFRGLIDKLDYLQQLGVNTLWITPIVDNIHFNKGVDFNSKQYAYHGYWAKDFEKLDEHLGDFDTFKELIDKAHDRGIKLMVDVVLNHTGYGLKPNDDRPGITEEDKQRFASMLRTDGVSTENNPIRGEVAGLPDFKTEEPAVRNQVVQWQTDWLMRAKTDRGDTIDYYRVDTVKHVDDTTWKAFKNKLTEENPNFKLIGEYFGGSIDNPGTYLNTGEMDSLLDFEFKTLAQNFVNGKMDQVERSLEERDAKINNTAMLGQFLSSHDEDGFLSERVSGDKGKLMVAAALQITSKGQPVIYYGEELGRSGKNAMDMGKGEFSWNRTDMPWDKIDQEQMLHDHYAKLLHIRAKYSKLMSKGTRSKLAGGDDRGYLIFDKSYEREHLVIGLNPSSGAQENVTIKVPFTANTTALDEYSGQKYQVNAQQEVTVRIPGKDQGGTILLSGVTTPIPDPNSKPDTQPNSSSGNSGNASGSVISTAQYEPTSDGIVYTPSTMIEMVDQNGKNVVQVTLEAVEIQKGLAMLQANSGPHHLIVQGTKSDNMRVIWPYKALNPLLEAAKQDPSLRVSVQLPTARYELPLKALDLNELAKQLHSTSQEVSLHVQVREAVEPLTESMKRAVKAIGAVPVGHPYEFVMTARAKEQVLDLSNFGPVFTDRELTLNESVDSRHATVVVLNPLTMKLSFAPAVFKKDGGKTKVIIKGNGNSLYGVLLWNKTFEDVQHHWAKQEIGQLASKLVIHGETDRSFGPGRPVTRAEFAAMLVRALGFTADTQDSSKKNTFTDVPSDAWYAEAIELAVQTKLLKGFNDGTFRPNDMITREQMAGMIANAIQYVKQADRSEVPSIQSYADANRVSDWAQEAMSLSIKAHIMKGFDDHTLRPTVNSSRAESAVVMYRLLEYLEFM